MRRWCLWRRDGRSREHPDHPDGRVGRSGIAVLVMAGVLVGGWTAVGVPDGPATATGDPQLEQLLADHPAEQERIEEIQFAMAESQRLARDILGYLELLNTRTGFREHEVAYLQVLRADSLVERNLLDFEYRTATMHGSNEQVAYLDVILVDYPELAELLFEVERLAGADEELIGRYVSQFAFLIANPDQAEPIFEREAGPTYEGPDRMIGPYVEHLAAHPEIYHALWRVYALVDQDLQLSRRIYDHWFWFRPRPPIRRAWWSYRLLAARDPDAHQVVWDRRLFLGTDAALAEEVWRHRLTMATRQEMRAYVRYLLDHPEVAAAILAHHRAAAEE